MKRRRFLNVKGEFDPQKAFVLFRGLPSYQESRGDFVLGVDLLATQSAAYRAYAGVDARRDVQAARAYREKAAAVRGLINELWWDEKAGALFAPE